MTKRAISQCCDLSKPIVFQLRKFNSGKVRLVALINEKISSEIRIKSELMSEELQIQNIQSSSDQEYI